MKHVLATATCAAALVASLAGCGGGENKSTQPSTTSTPRPTGETNASATATARPTATPPTPAPTKTGTATLAAQSTYMYRGLKVLVNLPAEIPARSRPAMRTYSDFLQAAGQTMADNKADPRLRGLATPRVIKYLIDGLDPKADHSVGTLIFTVTKIQPAGTRLVTISACMDQEKALPINKAGKPIPDTNEFPPVLKMRGDVSDLGGGNLVTGLEFSAGKCA